MQPLVSLPPPTRPPAALGVLALHGALLVLLLQSDAVRRVMPEVLPVTVSLLSAPAPTPAHPPAMPLPAPAPPTAPVLPMLSPPPVDVRQPTLAAPAPAPEQAPVTTAAAATPVVAAVVVALPAPAPTVPATAPAEPRQIPPGAISYRVPPAIAVPLASRRLRESGTVWLRVRVDRQGLPVQVTVQQSSGYPRLDEQALAAMQAARFVPQTENGAPIDWVVIAPLAYDID